MTKLYDRYDAGTNVTGDLIDKITCATAMTMPEQRTTPSLLVVSKPVNQEAVDLLEKVLDRVKRGELNFVAVLGTGPDGSVYDAWTGGPDVRPYTVLGALAAMSHTFATQNIE